MASFLSSESRAGKPIQFQGNTLVPVAKVWQMKLPWAHGGLIWNRPASVVVTGSNGQETIVPVQDVTRQAAWMIFAVCFASLLLALMSARQRPTQHY